MSLRLPPHSHCMECEEPIDEGETFCSEECERAYKGREAQRKRRMPMWYLAAFAAITIITSLSLFI